MSSLGTILHPMDFSEHSEFAFQLACALAWDYKARLVLLHVVPVSMVIYAGGAAPPDHLRFPGHSPQPRNDLFLWHPICGIYKSSRIALFRIADALSCVPRGNGLTANRCCGQ
jgi:hypothetical protein